MALKFESVLVINLDYSRHNRFFALKPIFKRFNLNVFSISGIANS
ncbi:hypothetical protein N9B92_00100 [Porticoccaceae bacterium]|nr:hypothetical protein [Porticoccaceae bacterium]